PSAIARCVLPTPDGPRKTMFSARWLSTAGIREAALEAVRDSEWSWHIVFISPSLSGVRAAALAGLAVTPMPAGSVGHGLRILSEKSGMPPLPNLDFAIFERARPWPAASALAAALAF